MRSVPGNGMVALVAPPIAWACLGASFVIGLAAVVRMAGPAPGGHVVSGVIRLPDYVTIAIATLFGLAVLVFLVDLLRRALARRHGEDEEGERAEEPNPVPPWLRRLTLILSLVNVVVLVYLFRRAVIEGGFFLGAGGLAGGLALPETASLSAPAVFIWAFGILALAAGLGALGLALWVAFGDHLTREHDEGAGEGSPAPLQALVEESLEDLRSEVDPRHAIVRCYARFERAVTDAGIERRPWFTPMELMRETLARLPVPRAAVPTLTGLFELARFSHHALGPRERDRALEALHEIKAAMETRDGDGERGRSPR
ncbi:MAG: DUF4129 domain-containing protein [Candidatus Rokuibacteriota bacterium]